MAIKLPIFEIKERAAGYQSVEIIIMDVLNLNSMI